MHEDMKKMKAWVETWKRAGPALRAAKVRELQAHDYGKDCQLIDDMLQWAVDHAQERPSSGLVEQQRFFRKMRTRDGQ